LSERSLLRRINVLCKEARILGSVSEETGRGRHAPQRPQRGLGDGGDGGEVAFGGHSKACFENVDAQVFEGVGHGELFLGGHAAAGGLLAVAEGGVEDLNFVRHGSEFTIRIYRIFVFVSNTPILNLTTHYLLPTYYRLPLTLSTCSRDETCFVQHLPIQLLLYLPDNLLPHIPGA